MEMAINAGISELFYHHQHLHFDEWFEGFQATSKPMSDLQKQKQREAILRDAFDFAEQLFNAFGIEVDPHHLMQDYLFRLGKPT